MLNILFGDQLGHPEDPNLVGGLPLPGEVLDEGPDCPTIRHCLGFGVSQRSVVSMHDYFIILGPIVIDDLVGALFAVGRDSTVLVGRYPFVDFAVWLLLEGPMKILQLGCHNWFFRVQVDQVEDNGQKCHNKKGAD